MGKVIRFPKSNACPPHVWVAIYGDSDVDEDEDEDVGEITGRVCERCSLIETKESLILSKGLGGKGQGFLHLEILPRLERLER